MDFNLHAPSALYNGSSFSNTARVMPPNGVTEVDPSANSSTWNVILLNGTDIEVIKTSDVPEGIIEDCSTFPKTINYTVRWINHGFFPLRNIILYDHMNFVNANYTGAENSTFDYPFEITNLDWNTSSPSTTMPTNNFNNTNGTGIPSIYNHGFWGNISTLEENGIETWTPTDTITLTYSLTLQMPLTIGCGGIDWSIRNSATFGIPNTSNVFDANSSNNHSELFHHTSCTNPPCSQTGLEIIKTSDVLSGDIGDCTSFPKTINYTIRSINHGPSFASGVVLYDYMNFVNAVSPGTSNAIFNYPFDISNLVWETSSPNTTLPTSNFNNTNGTGVPSVYNHGSWGNIATLEENNITVWAPNDTITLTYTFTIHAPVITGCNEIDWIIRNRAVFSISDTLLLEDMDDSNNSSTVSHYTSCAPSCPQVDIEVMKTSDSNEENIAGRNTFPKTINYTIFWVNQGPSSANRVVLLDYINFVNADYTGLGNATFSYPFEISGLEWKTSSSNTTLPVSNFTNTNGASTPSNYSHGFWGNVSILEEGNVSLWEIGDTITLSYKLTIQAPLATGCGKKIDWNVKNLAIFHIPDTLNLADTNDFNNQSETWHYIETAILDLSISKSVSPTIIDTGSIMTMTTIFQNAADSADASMVYWLDTLPSTFEIDTGTINCIAIGSIICPMISYNSNTRILRQDFTNFPSGSVITITYDGLINSPFPLLNIPVHMLF